MLENIKRLKFLFKRKDKNFKSKISNSITDIEFVDTNNFSDTLYNIICSEKNIPCDVNSRTLNYDEMINIIKDYEYDILDFTNTIYIIYFNNIDFELLEFINILNMEKHNINYELEHNKIVLSMTYTFLEYIYNLDSNNKYLCTLRNNMVFNFDNRLTDSLIESNNCDLYHDIFVKNKQSILLPIFDNTFIVHIYVIENQLLNFINTELSKEFDFNKLSLDSILRSFTIIICFDNFGFNLDVLKYFSDLYINKSRRIICKFNIKSIKQLVEYYDTNKNSDEEEILFNFFNNTYHNTIEALQEKINNNINLNSLTSDDLETGYIKLLDGVDEIL